jgi:pilus assembly protein CpaB
MATNKFKFTKRTLAVVMAILLAGVATVAISTYVDGVEAAALAEGEPVEAFVAKDTIPAGTTAEQAIAAGLVLRQPVPRRNLPAGAIGALTDIEGQVALANIGPGEEIVADRFAAPDQVASGLQIPEGHHAISVQVGVPEGVAGFVEPGDRVGILARVEVPDPTQPRQPVDPNNPAAGTEEATEPRVQYVLMGVEVLAVGSRTGPITEEQAAQEGAAPVGLLATVALTPADAEKLVFAQLEGSLYFTLMPDDAETVTTPGRIADTIFRD